MAETKKPKPGKGPESGPEAGPDTTDLGDDASATPVDEAAGALAETDTAGAEMQDAPATDDLPADPPSDPSAESLAEAPANPPATTQRANRGGFVPALIGGVLAAFLGFFAAQSEIFASFLPGASDRAQMAEDLGVLRDSDAGQTAALAALGLEIDAIDQPDLGPLTAQQASLQREFTLLRGDMDTQQAYLRDLESRIAQMAARLEVLEMRPITDNASAEAIAAYDRELAALQQAMADQRAEVEAMVDTARATVEAARVLEQGAATAARNAQNQATLARLQRALDEGSTYASTLAELVAAGVEVPSALKTSADDGISTLAALADAFPAPARAALAAVRADADDRGGLGGFLQRHLSARSIQPRQGKDADAILSRAEAAVIAGDLATALAEVAALPEVARDKMQAWAETATIRVETLQAADELAQSLNTN